ncbi:hypothetical protein JYT20_01060 [Rhodothermus sp. AH-315-K08]|nr:hypothetical protein [Rhodothermus sp. AH-315-K08]
MRPQDQRRIEKIGNTVKQQSQRTVVLFQAKVKGPYKMAGVDLTPDELQELRDHLHIHLVMIEPATPEDVPGYTSSAA